MAYKVEVGPKARRQLDELDAAVGAAVERKIIWLAQNAATMDRAVVNRPQAGGYRETCSTSKTLRGL